jgi:hypothetical protein
MVTSMRTVYFSRNLAQGPCCVGCGCDDHHACRDENGQPCHWVKLDPPLCSACAEEGLALDAREPKYATFVQGGGGE